MHVLIARTDRAHCPNAAAPHSPPTLAAPRVSPTASAMSDAEAPLQPGSEPAEIVIPDYVAQPTAPPASTGSAAAAPSSGASDGLAKKLQPISIAAQNDTLEAQEAAGLQGDLYNITFWMIVVQVVRLAVKLVDHYVDVDMGTGSCEAGATDCVQEHTGGKGSVGWRGGLIEVYCYTTVFALAWFGAKHLDSTLLLMYVASSGFCFLIFIITTIGVFEEFFSANEPLVGTERDACLTDPECDVNDNEQRHILNQLGLLALQVLFGLGVWTGWKLYTHPMTTSERRVPDRVPDAEAMALGGGDIPAPVPGFFDKFFVTRVHADPAAADPHGATEAANLQVCFPPPPIETDL